MRDILFKAKAINRDRGYHRTNYKNGDWVYGLVTRLYDERFENIPAEMTDLNGVSGIEIDHNTICQYTGLTDNNGNKVWENDVVEVWWIQRTLDKPIKAKKYKAVVEFGNPNSLYSWGWQLRFLEDFPFNKDILLWIDMDEAGAYCEVIGNIFDNPELIGE